MKIVLECNRSFTNCKSMYASIRPSNHLDCSNLNIVPTSKVSDSRCRHMVRLTHNIYGLGWADYIQLLLPGPAHVPLLHYPPRQAQISWAAYNIQEKCNETIWQSYHVRTHTNSNIPQVVVTLWFIFRLSGLRGNDTSTWLQSRGRKFLAYAICTSPRSNEELDSGQEKRWDQKEKRNAKLITFLRSGVRILYWPMFSAPQVQTSLHSYLHS